MQQTKQVRGLEVQEKSPWCLSKWQPCGEIISTWKQASLEITASSALCCMYSSNINLICIKLRKIPVENTDLSILGQHYSRNS